MFVDVFKFLMKEHNILALYTYHNDEDYFNENNIAELAKKNNIPVHYEKITEEVLCDYFENKDCNLLFSAEYNAIIPIPEDLKSFRGINTHSSLLPIGRSYYPIEAAMDMHYIKSGITMHKLASSLDSGDILAQREYDITIEDDSIDIYLKCSSLAYDMIGEIMADFEFAWKNAKAQIKSVPYWKRPLEEHMIITHDMTVEQATEVYRCFNKMAKIEIDNEKYYISNFSTGKIPLTNPPHQIISVNSRQIIFGLKDGNLRLDIEAVI